jgi:hypothetical protein
MQRLHYTDELMLEIGVIVDRYFVKDLLRNLEDPSKEVVLQLLCYSSLSKTYLICLNWKEAHLSNVWHHSLSKQCSLYQGQEVSFYPTEKYKQLVTFVCEYFLEARLLVVILFALACVHADNPFETTSQML